MYFEVMEPHNNFIDRILKNFNFKIKNKISKPSILATMVAKMYFQISSKKNQKKKKRKQMKKKSKIKKLR
jgi:hypothetical protein